VVASGVRVGRNLSPQPPPLRREGEPAKRTEATSTILSEPLLEAPSLLRGGVGGGFFAARGSCAARFASAAFIPRCPAALYFFAGPRSYTGQDLAELHLVGSPPLVERLVSDLLTAGARAAGPGEFTLRAFLAGKKDLPQAEAVQAVIEAAPTPTCRPRSASSPAACPARSTPSATTS
jgi:tRNA modification GTPase